VRCPRCMRRALLSCSCVPSLDGGFHRDSGEGFARFLFWLAMTVMVGWAALVIVTKGNP